MTTNTKTYSNIFSIVRLDDKGKIESITGRYDTEIMKEFLEDKDLNFINTNIVHINSIKLFKSILKNIGIKYSKKSFHQLGVNKVVYKNVGFTSELLKSKVFKIQLNTDNYIDSIVVKLKDREELEAMTPDFYNMLCEIINADNEFFIKKDNQYIPTEYSYKEKLVVDNDGFLIKTKQQETKSEDVLTIAEVIKVMGYGGGPGYVKGGYYKGKFEVKFINDSLLKITAIEDSQREFEDILKGSEFFVSTNCIQEMY